MSRGNDGGIRPKVEVAMLSDVERVRVTVRVREVETGWRGGASLVESGKASPKRPPTVHCGLASRVSHNNVGHSVSCRSAVLSNYPGNTLNFCHHVNKAPRIRVSHGRGSGKRPRCNMWRRIQRWGLLIARKKGESKSDIKLSCESNMWC